jgi:hypothetical protein
MSVKTQREEIAEHFKKYAPCRIIAGPAIRAMIKAQTPRR